LRALGFDVKALANANDIVRIHRRGRIASMFGIEGGEAINGNLALLREFRRAGVLYMTLTHCRSLSRTPRRSPCRLIRAMCLTMCCDCCARTAAW